MDALLLAMQNVSEQLLPILGAVALIFLCIFLNKLWKLIEQITATVKQMDPTIQKLDQSMEKVQAPLDTAVKYSHTLDKVHDKTGEVFGKVADFASDNAENIKNMMESKLNQADSSNGEVKENDHE